jgi:sarcosine oxidase subunit delta
MAEFRFQGEVTERPRERPSLETLAGYVYLRRNVAGVQREWWYHRHGCEAWFIAERDTRTNQVLSVEIPAPAARHGAQLQEATGMAELA